MNVCFIANADSIHTIRWVNYFAQEGYQVSLITDKPAGAWARATLQPTIALYDLTEYVKVRKIRYLLWVPIVRHLLAKIRPDVLHAHNISGGGWLGAFSSYHPFIVTSHGSDLMLLSQKSWAHRTLSMYTLRRVDHLSCVSRELRDKAVEYGVPANKLTMIDLGIDTAIYSPSEDISHLRLKLGLKDVPTVLSIRAIREIYNPLVIINNIPAVLKDVPTTQFVIFTYNADPTLLIQLQSTVDDMGVAESVHFIGKLATESEIADYYCAADVVISIPVSDGTPKSVQEALACGAVPILSDLPSLHEWVKHEQEVLFIPTNGGQRLSKAIVRLLTDDSLRQTLRTNGIKLVCQRFDSNICMHHNAEIYKEAMRF